MAKPWKIYVTASDLQTALEALVPASRSRRKSSVPLSLEIGEKRGVLALWEARHGTRKYELPVKGRWPATAQVDGTVLRKMVEKYPPDVHLELEALADAICIRHAASELRLKRLDSGGKSAIKRKPPRPDPRHRGPVEVPPDPTQKRVAWADTWDFSARVPMPQHRLPRKM